LIGADADSAHEMLDAIKNELETNDLLLADFPEVCFPIRCLDGIANRARGQTCLGKHTHISLKQSRIVLPTVDGSKASGSIIRVAGITGRIRGMKFVRPGGEPIRPDLVIVDDPQTDDSATSVSQCEKRERILKGAILGLAGPGKKIAGVCPCTVIANGDLADRLLDRDLNPEWQGERMRMLYSFPVNLELWEQYNEIRVRGLKAERGIAKATAFYRKHLRRMNKGARPAWKARFNDDEISAIQHAMNFWLSDPGSFECEYQNEPSDPTADDEFLNADAIAAKTSGFKRHEIPSDCSHVTAFVDCHSKALYWMVAAWSPTFDGYVIDYGTTPDQGLRYYTMSSIDKTLARRFPGRGLEARLLAGLAEITDNLYSRTYRRDDGVVMPLSIMLIDGGWKPKPVYRFCRTAGRGGLYPSRGFGIGPGDMPIDEWRAKKGERKGEGWRCRKATDEKVLHVQFDANVFKTFANQRFATALGDPGSLSLFEARPIQHKIIGDQATAEYREQQSGKWGNVDLWKAKPKKPDNHFLDTIVGNCVAASMCGCVLRELATLVAPRSATSNTKGRRKVAPLDC